MTASAASRRSIASRGVVGIYRPLLEPMGLTHPQCLVMLVLDPGTLSPLLKRLEAIGYLRRDRSADDERQPAVTLTDEGMALREKALLIHRRSSSGSAWTCRSCTRR